MRGGSGAGGGGWLGGADARARSVKSGGRGEAERSCTCARHAGGGQPLRHRRHVRRRSTEPPRNASRIARRLAVDGEAALMSLDDRAPRARAARRELCYRSNTSVSSAPSRCRSSRSSSLGIGSRPSSRCRTRARLDMYSALGARIRQIVPRSSECAHHGDRKRSTTPGGYAGDTPALTRHARPSKVVVRLAHSQVEARVYVEKGGRGGD